MWRWLWLCLLPLIGSAEYVERAVAPAEARSYSLPDASGCYAVTVTGACGAETLESAPSNRVCRTAPISLNWSQQMLCEDGSGLAGIERFTIYEWMEGGPPPPLLQPGPGSLASLWQFDASTMDPPEPIVAAIVSSDFVVINTSATTWQVSLPTIAPGNSIFLVSVTNTTVVLNSIADDGSDAAAYTLDHTFDQSSQRVRIYRRAVVNDDPDLATWTFASAPFVGFVGYIEVSGLGADPGVVSPVQGSRAFVATPSVTTTTTGDNHFGIGFVNADVGRTFTQPSGWDVIGTERRAEIAARGDLGSAGSVTYNPVASSAHWTQAVIFVYEPDVGGGSVEGSVAQAAAGGDVAGSVARLPASHAQAASAGIDLADTVRRALAASQAGAADDAVSSRVRALRSTSQGAAGESAHASVLRAVETITAGGSSADNAIAWLRALVSAEQAAAGAAAADALVSMRVALAQGAAGSDAATGDILGSLEVNTSSGAAGGDVSATLATFAVSIHQTAAGAESGAAAARLLLGLEHAAAAGLSVDVSADVVRSISEGAAGAASQDREVFGQRVSVVQAAAGSDGMSAAQRAVAAAIQSAIGDGIAYAIQAGLLNIEQGAAAGFSATAVLESDRFVLVGEVRIDSQSPVIRVVSIRSISGTNDA